MLRRRSVLRCALVAGLAALALTVPACSSPGLGVPAGPATPPAPAGPGRPAAVAALDFSALTLDGGELDAATLAGKPVLLWFWAPF